MFKMLVVRPIGNRIATYYMKLTPIELQLFYVIPGDATGYVSILPELSSPKR